MPTRDTLSDFQTRLSHSHHQKYLFHVITCFANIAAKNALKLVELDKAVTVDIGGRYHGDDVLLIRAGREARVEGFEVVAADLTVVVDIEDFKSWPKEGAKVAESPPDGHNSMSASIVMSCAILAMQNVTSCYTSTNRIKS